MTRLNVRREAQVSGRAWTWRRGGTVRFAHERGTLWGVPFRVDRTLAPGEYRFEVGGPSHVGPCAPGEDGQSPTSLPSPLLPGR
jgi:hypothetical protein